MKRKAILLALFVISGGWGGMAASASAKPLHFEIAQVARILDENGEIDLEKSTFVFDEAPVDENGLPAHGNPFVVKGFIYEAGTLTCTEAVCNGVNPDGTAEFPDRVVGIWTCRGWFIDKAAQTESGAFAATSQIYDLGSTQGEETVTTEGFEFIDPNEPRLRAITGGTGRYRRARGQVIQTLLGFNITAGLTLGVKLEVR